MTIHATGGKLHWNYLLALDADLESLSRYVEFAEPNLGVYSIELAHLLFAAASEVDVLAKLVCRQIAPRERASNIDQYRPILLRGLPNLPVTTVRVPRYGLSFKPWENWAGPENPDWWRSYNKVKHQRDVHFAEATLKNCLNSLGALLIMTFHYYSRELGINDPARYPQEVTRHLTPGTSLLRFDEAWYDELLRA